MGGWREVKQSGEVVYLALITFSFLLVFTYPQNLLCFHIKIQREPQWNAFDKEYNLSNQFGLYVTHYLVSVLCIRFQIPFGRNSCLMKAPRTPGHISSGLENPVWLQEAKVTQRVCLLYWRLQWIKRNTVVYAAVCASYVGHRGELSDRKAEQWPHQRIDWRGCSLHFVRKT